MRSVLILLIAISLLLGLNTNEAAAQPTNPDVTLDLQFMEWAVYTLLDWSTNENLFVITITNNESVPITGVMLEMQILVANSPAISNSEIAIGVTYGDDEIGPGQSLIYRNNSDFMDNAIRGSAEYSTAFQDAVFESGSSLPAGDYSYNFRLLYDYEWAAGIATSNYPRPGHSSTIEIDQASATLTISQPGNPELIMPGEPTDEGLPVYDMYPYFNWMTSGATGGQIMSYNLIICEKEETQSNNEAIQNLPHYERGWDNAFEVQEQGFPTSTGYGYQASDEAFSLGNKYVWQVYVRSARNMENSSAGFTSESEIFCFQYGDIPEPITPPRDGTVSTVTPPFIWSDPTGAPGYQVRVSGEDDPLVENIYWEEDATTTTLDHVPENEYLVPGNTYFWKVRALPDGAWCEPAQFTVDPIEYINPAYDNDEMTVLPSFNLSAPQGIGSYEFQISGPEDPELNNPNSFFPPSVPYTYTTTEDFPLQPGFTYYWRVLPLTQSGDLIGVLDDYDYISHFNVLEVTNIMPDPGGTIQTLCPIFSWTPPSGIESWEIRIQDNIDEGIQAGITANSYIYPPDAELPLVPGKTYYWRLIEIMNDNMVGEVEDYPEHSFSVEPMALQSPPNSTPVSTVFPNFMWEGPMLCPGDQYEFQISDINDPEVNNPEYTFQTTDISFIYPTDADLALLPDQTYFWKVRVLSNEHGLIGNPEDFPVSSFTVEFGAELDVSVSIPSNAPLFPQFSWSSIAEATSYMLLVCNTPNDYDIYEEAAGLNSTNYEYTSNNEPLEFNTQYYAKVKAFQVNTLIVESEFEPFMCEMSGPGLTVTINDFDPLHPVFDWNAVPGATTYQLLLSLGTNMAQAFWNPITGLTSITYPDDEESLNFGTTYFAQVQARDENGEPYGPASTIISVTIAAVEYDLAVNVPIATPLNPAFNWNTIPSAASYNLQVSELEDMGSPFYDEVIQGATSYNYSNSDPPLMMSSTYYARVQALNTQGNAIGDPSAIEPFMTPEIEYVINFQLLENQILNPIISWLSIQAATSYQVFLYEGSDLTNSIFDVVVQGLETTYPPDAPLLNFGTFYAVVLQALNGVGDPIGPPSDPIGFTIPAAPVIAQLSPTSDDPVPTTSPEFMWQTLPFIDHYEIKVAATDNMVNTLWEAQTQAGSATYPSDNSLAYGNTYYWQVIGYSVGDQMLAQSPVSYFTLRTFVPIPQTPGSGVTILNLNPNFTWSDPSFGGVSPAYYVLTLGTSALLQSPFYQTQIAILNHTYPQTGLPLLYSSSYYWRVQAYNSDDIAMGPASAVLSFNTPLGGATLVSPVDISTTMTPMFEWTGVTGADHYEFGIYSDEGLNNQVWWSGDIGQVTNYQYQGSDLQYENTYYWYVQAYDQNGQPYGLASNSAFFVTPSIGAPALVAPINGLTTSNLNPTFTFSGIPTAESYAVAISTDAGMGSPLATINTTATNVQYQEDPALDWDVLYYWQVTALDGGGGQTGELSIVESFRTPVFTAPSLNSPSGEITSNRPEFQWDELAGTAGYHIQVSADDGFGDVVWDAQVSTNSTTYGASDALIFDQTYHWHVRGLDTNGNYMGEWSGALSFTPIPSLAVTLNVPVNAEVFSLNPTFEWNAVAGAAKYLIVIYSDENLANQLWSANQLTTTTVIYPGQGVPPMVYGNSYWWQVTALNSEGNQIGSASVVATFTVSGALLPQLSSPLGITVEDLNPTFTWDPIEGVNNFWIQVALDENFTQIVWSNANITANSVPYGGAIPLIFGTTYRWRVKTMNNQGQALSDFSDTGEFITPSGEIQVELLFGP